MSSVRKRQRLVPKDGMECFEIRIAYYCEMDGSTGISFQISDPDSPHLRPPLIEVLGLLEAAKAFITEKYAEELE